MSNNQNTYGFGGMGHRGYPINAQHSKTHYHEKVLKLCITSTIVCVLCIVLFHMIEQEKKNSYDYSQIQEYTGEVIGLMKIKSNDSITYYTETIELENGKTVDIDIYNNAYDTVGSKVKVYTDNTYYGFTEESVANKSYNSSALFFIASMIIALVFPAISSALWCMCTDLRYGAVNFVALFLIALALSI
jgi:hypothetical protein